MARQGDRANARCVNGGVIYRHPGTKNPTGLLRDNAMGLVDRLIPPPMEEGVAEAVDEGEQRPEADESIELERIPVTEIAARLGEVEDAKTLAGLLLYLRRRAL